MIRRHELSDAEGEFVRSLLSESLWGRRRSDDRAVLNGIVWKFRTRVAWRDMPERYGPWATLHTRFRRWAKDGTFERMLQAAQVGPAGPYAGGSAPPSPRRRRSSAGPPAAGRRVSAGVELLVPPYLVTGRAVRGFRPLLDMTMLPRSTRDALHGASARRVSTWSRAARCAARRSGLTRALRHVRSRETTPATGSDSA
ncbi:transposase [Streptomyces sp. 2MCAF27]